MLQTDYERMKSLLAYRLSCLSMSAGVALGGQGVEWWLSPDDWKTVPGQRLVIAISRTFTNGQHCISIVNTVYF